MYVPVNRQAVKSFFPPITHHANVGFIGLQPQINHPNGFHPQAFVGPLYSPGADTLAAGTEFRSGDWLCASPSCHYHNWSKNNHCMSCGSPKPLNISTRPSQANINRTRPLASGMVAAGQTNWQHNTQISGISSSTTPAHDALVAKLNELKMDALSEVPRYANRPKRVASTRKERSVKGSQPQTSPPVMQSSAAAVPTGPSQNSTNNQEASRNAAQQAFASSGHSASLPLLPQNARPATHGSTKTTLAQRRQISAPAGLNASSQQSTATSRSGTPARSSRGAMLARLTPRQSPSSPVTDRFASPNSTTPSPEPRPMFQVYGPCDASSTVPSQQKQQVHAELNSPMELVDYGIAVGAGINPVVASEAQAASTGSSSPITTNPPIINTGNLGPMCVQLGDWVCSVCSFVNWRRRKVCMRCYPFAEGNEVSASLANGALLAAQLAAGLPPHPQQLAQLTRAGRSHSGSVVAASDAEAQSSAVQKPPQRSAGPREMARAVSSHLSSGVHSTGASAPDPSSFKNTCSSFHESQQAAGRQPILVSAPGTIGNANRIRHSSGPPAASTAHQRFRSISMARFPDWNQPWSSTTTATTPSASIWSQQPVVNNPQQQDSSLTSYYNVSPPTTIDSDATAFGFASTAESINSCIATTDAYNSNSSNSSASTGLRPRNTSGVSRGWTTNDQDLSSSPSVGETILSSPPLACWSSSPPSSFGHTTDDKLASIQDIWTDGPRMARAPTEGSLPVSSSLRPATATVLGGCSGIENIWSHHPTEEEVGIPAFRPFRRGASS